MFSIFDQFLSLKDYSWKKFKVVLHVFEMMYYDEWKIDIDIHITESNLSHCRSFERKNRISCT